MTIIQQEKCEACWERYLRTRTVFRLGLCRDCFLGRTGRAKEQEEFRARHAAGVKRWLYERRLTESEIQVAALELALTSAIVCDTCLGQRRISNQCESCLGGSDARCTCDEMEEFDCPQCDGRGWQHREPERFKELCQELYDKHLNYLPKAVGD